MKTSIKCLSFIAALAIMSLAANAMATTLADWTFDTSKPSTAGPIAPESTFPNETAASGTSVHANGTTYSAPAGNGSSNSWSANSWSVGDYYQFTASTSDAGDNNWTISYDQTGSATGPRDFILQYSADGTNFTTFGSQYSLFSPTVTWAAGTPQTTNHQSDTVTALDGNTTAYFRIKDNTATSIGNGTVGSAGTGRVDNVIIGADPVPEPATLVLAAIGLGLGGFVTVRRRNAR